METVFILITLLSLFAFVVGMFSPKIVKCTSRGKVALIFIPLFLISTIIGSQLSDDTSTQEKIVNTTTQESESQEQNKPENNEIESSIGKPIEIGHFIYTIKSVSFHKSVGNEFVEQTADGIYMLVNLSIKNISSETRTLDGSFFAVTDTNGIKYEFSTDASTALEMSGNKTLFLKECQPNITTKGTLVFEVPDKGEYYLHLIGSFWGTKTVKVLLK